MTKEKTDFIEKNEKKITILVALPTSFMYIL